MKAGRQGAVLVVVAVSMVAAAAAGVAILSVATSSRYERIGLGSTGRAYYLAESGANFVWSHPSEVRTNYAGTYDLANGDRFVVAVSRQIVTNQDVAMARTIVQSTGIAHPGSAFESRQRVTFELLDRGITSDEGQDRDLFNDDGSFNDDAWDASGDVTPTPKDTGPSGGEGALDLQGIEGGLNLTWNENTNTLDKESSTLCRAYGTQTNLLGYDVQVKVQPYDNPGLGFGQHYLHGISFRLKSNGEGYGLSFFRSLPVAADNQRPEWARDARLDANFQALRGTNDHAVLWYRASSNAVFQLIASHRLLETDNVIRDYGPSVDPPLGITAYSTLLLQLDEGYDGGGNKRNEIAVYVQSPSNCPSCYPSWPSNDSSHVVWQTNSVVFPTPLLMSNSVWTNGVWTNFDNRISSSSNNYCSFTTVTNATNGAVQTVYSGPPEIGIHMFYDQSGANKKFFDDFAVRIQGSGTPYGGSQIQY